MRRRVVVVALAVGMAAGGTRAMACSTPPPEPIYSYRTSPDFPLQPFAAGRLGIVLPTWSPSYLVIAYRHLTGVGLNRAEQRALLAMWEQQHGPFAIGKPLPTEYPAGALREWLSASEEVRHWGVPVAVDRYRDDYSSYVNCLSDAFRTAAATLRARSERHGPRSEIVKQWVSAQDEVFRNCGGDPAHGNRRFIPQPLTQPADALAVADREYQIASALFYAGRFDEALAAFRGIAATASSPWRALARHLVVRCLLRKATLQPQGFDRDTLVAAEKELRAIVRDPSLRDVHAASRRLLRFVRVRVEPQVYCPEVALRMTRRQAGAGLALDVQDYVRGCWFPNPTDDLTLWITALTSTHNAAAAERQKTAASALDRWRLRQQPHWLLAALVAAAPGDPGVDEALAAGRALDETSRAARTIAYHLARVDLASGNRDAARARLDGLLAVGEAKLGRSAYNLALALRLDAAADLADLLRHAARQPAGWIDPDLHDAPATDKRDDALRMDGKTAEILSWLPLSVQFDAVMGDGLPPALRHQVASAAWVKAVALRDDDQALRIAQRLVELRPDSRGLLDAFLRAPDASARSREALMLLARRVYPPLVLSRGSLVGGVAPPPDKRLDWPYGQHDAAWHSWRCGIGQPFCTCSPHTSCSGCQSPSAWDRVQAALPAFLTEQQRAQTRKEWELLAALGSGPEFLCARAIEWAESGSKDLRAAEVLHRAVASTHWGCESDRLGALSRRAFRILHARYGNTPWAKRTNYWYRGR